MCPCGKLQVSLGVIDDNVRGRPHPFNQHPITEIQGLSCVGSPQTTSSFISHISLVCGMSQPSSLAPSSFESIFNAALEDYAKRSGTKLDQHHPLVKQLENCNSVDSISKAIQEHARRFHEFRGEDGKMMKSLKGAVQVLYTLSTSTVLSEGISIVSRESLISILVPKEHSIAVATFKGNTCSFWGLARRKSPSPFHEGILVTLVCGRR